MANKRTADYGGGYRPPKSNAPLVAVAVVATAAVIGLILVLVFARSSSSAAASSDPTASNPAPTQTYAGGGSGGTLAALPPLSGNGGGLMYMLNGKVAAISSTSITLAGNGPSVTAAINGSTQVTGNVTSVSGIKVGDQVTAQVGGQSSSSLVATAIQDPGSGP